MGLCSQIVILVIVTFFASSKVFAEHSNSSATKESPTRQLTSTEIFQILGRRSKSFLSGEICYEDFTKDEVTLAEIDSLTDEDLWFMYVSPNVCFYV
ncbi:unnamed protein product [Allacma fusca]|uniref:Uncharacterized protein n=1 Tax=Allacma fusca TaxID=39272 RepID=A0A8J2LRH2_9HEXA|nr:unnamed protein product [Allacma fusca]